MACSFSHDNLPKSFEKLPESQGGKGRHICAACAYDLGRTEAAQAEERLRERVRALTAELDKLRAGR